MKRFDAFLLTKDCDEYTNADLILQLKVGLKQINPSNGAAEMQYPDYGRSGATTRKIVKWDTASWLDWKKRFESSAQLYWNWKAWLLNDHRGLDVEVDGKTYRPNINCGFDLVLKDATGGGQFHEVINVVRLHSSETFFGSHSTLWDSKDITSVQKGTDSGGTAIMQRAHIHELGHLLGLGHVDEGKSHCPVSGDTNKPKCYGITDNDKKMLMGQGEQYHASYANPWREAMAEMSGKGGLKDASSWRAYTTKLYPRLPEELKKGTVITAKPQR